MVLLVILQTERVFHEVFKFSIRRKQRLAGNGDQVGKGKATVSVQGTCHQACHSKWL